jgi:hypothetical protein
MPQPDLDPLSRLAIRHGTDKWGGHLYTPVYHRLFAHLREAPVTLLEIGVGGYARLEAGGASLRMWAEYFPHGRIVGLDVEEKRLRLPPSVTVLQGSQSDAALLARVWEGHGPFDIIVDDGSHRAADVLASFRALYPRMGPGAFYVVEDVQTAFWPDFDGTPAATGTIVELAHHIFLAMHAIELRARGQEPAHTEFGDITAAIHLHRNLIAFERGANTYPSNYAYDPSDLEARAVRAALEEEAVRTPGPGPALIRAELARIAGDTMTARAAVAEGLHAWPDDPGLMLLAAMVGEGEG